jgi:Ca2+-binding RTX toxin-like protein
VHFGSVEAVYGGSVANWLTGTEQNDVLHANGTANTVEGRGGDDVVALARGTGTYSGGEGLDTLDLRDAFVVDLANGTAGHVQSGQDVMQVSGFEVLHLTSGFWLSVFGGDQDVLLTSDWSNINLQGGSGSETLLGNVGWDTADGGGGADSLYGGVGIDRLSGGTGDDAVFGGAELDFLYGGAGNDRVYGGDGNDIIDGGADNDIIYGGAGADTLVVGITGGWDQLVDWDDGQDRIDLSAFTFTSFAELTVTGSGPGNVHVAGSGFNLNVSLDGGETLDAGDFVF